MKNNTLASAFATALHQPTEQSAAVEKSTDAAQSPTGKRTACSAVLLAAVRRSLESCRDPSQLRMLQAFGPASQSL
ncbi:MAG TPA: hypothetical protein VFB54_20625 [Burkholderiales bacterium]|nr:hypothetical protein [Burkholderiales bacterium]